MVRLVIRRDMDPGALQVIVNHHTQNRSCIRRDHECLAHKIPWTDGLERSETVVTRQDHHQGLLDKSAEREVWHRSFLSKKSSIDFPFRKALRKQRGVLTRYHHVNIG